MATTMHRLQISLPHWQADFLAGRARQEGTSIAELVRRLVAREAEARSDEEPATSMRKIIGMINDDKPLIRGTPISENVDLYLAEAEVPSREGSREDS